MIQIAIEGCCHGELNAIYSSLPKTVHLLIICGDFQSLRNAADLNCLAVPPKYKKMGDFAQYYNGSKKAPVLTVFIGGNHEASNYLAELKYGGFVAPNIYYLGRTGSIWYNGLKITGMSGIYNEHNFMKLNTERFPYQGSALRSIYHYKQEDYFKLRLLKHTPDSIVVSHDWPEGIYKYGSLHRLLSKKPFFKADINKGELGSPIHRELLNHLKPAHWFSAHLHVRFTASVPWNAKKRQTSDTVPHSKKTKVPNLTDNDINNDDLNDEVITYITEEYTTNIESKSNTDEIELGLEDFDEEAPIVAEQKNTDEIEKEIKSDNIAESNKDEIELEISDNDNVICDSNNPSMTTETNLPTNENEIKLNIEDSDSELDTKETSASTNSFTRLPTKPTQFLALDKCLPRRQFLEVLNLPETDKSHPSFGKTDCLYHDPEFICALKVIERNRYKLQDLTYEETLYPSETLLKELSAEIHFELQRFKGVTNEEYDRLFKVNSTSFSQTAAPRETRLKQYTNPQTVEFTSKFGL